MDAEPHAAQAEHGVRLVQPFDRRQQAPALRDRLRRGPARSRGASSSRATLVLAGQELVQRRVDQPDDHRQPVHGAEEAVEVGALERQQRREALGDAPPARPCARIMRCTSGRRSVSKNMCSVRQSPMPCGAVVAGALGVGRVVGVAPRPRGGGYASAQPSSFGRYGSRDVGHHRRQLAGEDLAGRAVDRDRSRPRAASRPRDPQRARARGRSRAPRRPPPPACRTGARPAPRDWCGRRGWSGCRCAASMPCTSSGLVSGRTMITAASPPSPSARRCRRRARSGRPRRRARR